MHAFFTTYFGFEPSVAQLIWAGLTTVALWAIRWVWGGGFKHPLAYWLVAPPSLFVLLVAFGYASRSSEPAEPDFRIVPVKITLAQNPQVPDSTAILLGLNVFNNGRDSVATDWGLTASVPGEFSNKISKLLTIPDELRVGDPSGKAEVYRSENALTDKTLEPIKRGGLVPGILMFLFEDTKSEYLMRQDVAYTLSWKDSEGIGYTYTFHQSDLSVKAAQGMYLQQPGVPEKQIASGFVCPAPTPAQSK